MSRHVIFMTIDDAAHYSPQERAAIVAAYPAHEREARARGIPVLGSGRIFPVAEALIACAPFRLPRYWPRIGALDFGWDHPSAAVELAWDTEADVVYVSNGTLRLNNATAASATAAYIDNLDAGGAAVNGILDTFDDSTNTIKGQLTLRSKASAAISYVYNVTGAVVDGGGYRKLALAYVSGSGTLPTTANGIWLMFDRAGDKGADGAGAGDFTGPAASVTDNIVTFNGTTGKAGKDSGIKASDLIAGPASAVADNIATFNGATGKLAKDSGVAVSSLAPKTNPTFTGTPAAPTAAPGTNTTQIATTGFVKAAIDVVLGGVSAAFDTLAEIAAAMMQKAADNTGITAGFTVAAAADGTKSSGTYTPSPAGGNFKTITNGGAFTLAAPSLAGTYNMEIDITNNASAGAITFTGFASGYPKGDPLTTTNASLFKLHISKTAAGVTAVIEALQ